MTGARTRGAMDPLDVYLSSPTTAIPVPRWTGGNGSRATTYDPRSQQLTSPHVLIEGLIASDDHNSGRSAAGA